MIALDKRQRFIATFVVFTLMLFTRNPWVGFVSGVALWFFAETLMEQHGVAFSFTRDTRLLALLMLVLFVAMLGFIEVLPPFMTLGYALWPGWNLYQLLREA